MRFTSDKRPFRMRPVGIVEKVSGVGTERRIFLGEDRVRSISEDILLNSFYRRKQRCDALFFFLHFYFFLRCRLLFTLIFLRAKMFCAIQKI